jgi:hypothetical protein
MGHVGEGLVPGLQNQMSRMVTSLSSIGSDKIGVDAQSLLDVVRRFDIQRSVKSDSFIN